MRRSDRLTGKKRPNGTSAAGVAAAGQPRLAVATTPSATSQASADSTPTAASAAAPSDASAAAGPGSDRGFRFVDRRALLRLAGTAAVVAPATSLLAACTGSKGSSGVRPVRIGMVTPQSGALSSFASADLFVTDHMTTWFKDHGGIAVGNSTHPVQIFVRDSQSTFARAAKATTQLIYEDKVDIVLVDATSDTVNPVADQCEVAGVPCISTMSPWESWYFSRGGDVTLKNPFNWTFHFFAGLNDYYQAYASMWGDRVSTDRTVGALWPNSVDGQWFSHPKLPFRQGLDNNWKLVNPKLLDGKGSQQDYLYQPGTKDFTQVIAAFQAGKVEIVTGILDEADFAQFERNANSMSFQPKIITISKAAMFDNDLRTIGAQVSNNLTTELFWSDSSPNRSFVTNQPSKDLGDQYRASNGRQTTPQQLGASMALFDVAAQALSAVNSIDDRKSIATALKSLTARTILGDVKFGAREGLPQNVATIPLNGAQWRWHQDSYSFDLVQVNSSGNNALPNQGQLGAITYDT
ncbi:ABC transporter substrate-binding protein [Pseudofrankia sp. DC12]|uniref:ABC transporter substrate-binding protein n=1 Tax=Pseudofrankia sp. DC12 TaxID=683315 RepID=UPI0005F82492|nr:ABC transporter substrate-binding protein [Pseudofrankia sp. DC12]